jgi:DNA-binding transcriptional regulator YiaG
MSESDFTALLPADRKPGDAIPAGLIRELRQRMDLTPEELAFELGLRSGKNVVQAWEAGQSVCDGPAAELILRLLGVERTDVPGIAAEELSSAVDVEWSRGGKERTVNFWRQFVGVPHSAPELGTDEWLRLFPELALPQSQRVHGFPFVDVAAATVYGIGPRGWSGSIPNAKTESPRYAWLLRRNGGFVYRERPWEDDPMAITHGNTHAGALLELALAGAFFMRRVVERWQLRPETKVLIRFDLHGMKGRGIVAGEDDPTGMLVDVATQKSNEDHIKVSTNCSVAQLLATPHVVGVNLVRELVIPLRPDLARGDTMKEQLRRRFVFDRRNPARFRSLGFLDSDPAFALTIDPARTA